MIANDVSFNLAVSAELRGLIFWNRPDLLNALPTSVGALSRYNIVDGLKERKPTIQTLLLNSGSEVALSVDIWTSPNHFSFLGVVAHFVGKLSEKSTALNTKDLHISDAYHQPRDLFICFKNLLGDHTGANIAVAILSVIHDYNIALKFHCFVGDNATNNDSERVHVDPLTWWLKVGQTRYTTLFKMALNFLSIPSTSCECEGCFSKARRIIIIDRGLLFPSTVEALRLQRN
jgi:hypothetical protein